MRRRLPLSRAVAVTAALVALASALACGTDPVGVESCRKIEFTRCEWGPACGIDLTHPVHKGDTPEQDVGACKRFYDDACLHGLEAPKDPGAIAVQACVDAINTGDCAIVKAPETSPACAFLIPPAAPPADAAPESAPAEAAADAAATD